MKIPSPSPDRTRVFHRIDSRRANPRRFIPDTNLGRGITFKLIIPVASRDCRHSETASVTRVLLRPACNFNNNYDHARCWRGEGRIRGGRMRTREEGKRRIPYIYIYTHLTDIILTIGLPSRKFRWKFLFPSKCCRLYSKQRIITVFILILDAEGRRGEQRREINSKSSSCYVSVIFQGKWDVWTKRKSRVFNLFVIIVASRKMPLTCYDRLYLHKMSPRYYGRIYSRLA